MNEKHAVVLFYCVFNLFKDRINIIKRHHKKKYLPFAALQSDTGKKILSDHGIEMADPDTFILVENGKTYDRTTAALRIVKHLNGLWPAMYAFIIVPPFLRDIVYRIIAKNRYKWWGERESCMIPTPEVRKKFL
jgi:predicted DCC family thiol-disulfide oxidoreductase YuxK